MPSRILRENIRFSERVSTLTDREFRLYILLLTLVDDYGRYYGDPHVINSHAFPYGGTSPATSKATLIGLHEKGLIRIYQAPDDAQMCKNFVEVAQFNKPGNRPRAAKSKFPAFNELQDDANNCKQMQANAPVFVSVSDNVFVDEDGQESAGSGTGKGGMPKRILIEEFETGVWPHYPRKEGKASALDDFIKARRAGESVDAITAGVKAYAAHITASGTEPRYIKQGGTWFHQKGWLDDYSTNGAAGPRKLRRAV